MPFKHPILRLALLGALLFALVTAACANPNKPAQEVPGDPRALQHSVGNFHINLRWARYEQAALFVAESYRQTFLGRYEELGDDFRITDLELKGVTYEDDGKTAEVDVAQESYKEPDMVVKTERYVEIWKPVDGTWMLHDRLLRDEHRARKKEAAAAPAREAAAPEGP